MAEDGHPLHIGQPVKLEKYHSAGDFESGAEDLDEWVRKYAWVNHASGNARVFVCAKGGRIVAYYTLSTVGVAKRHVPVAAKRGGAPLQVPCILLGRMAVDKSVQGAHVGRSLLIDAILRVMRLSDEVGFRALLIHARDENARNWYQHQARAFQQSPSDPLHLFLPIKALRRIANEGPPYK